jgi:hypothetical protein
MFPSHFVVRRGGFFCYAIITLSHYNIKKYVQIVFFVVPSDICLGFNSAHIATHKANSPVATATLRSPYYSYVLLFRRKYGFAFLYHFHPHYHEQAPIVG